jgi:signal transduction histidine kinase
MHSNPTVSFQSAAVAVPDSTDGEPWKNPGAGQPRRLPAIVMILAVASFLLVGMLSLSIYTTRSFSSSSSRVVHAMRVKGALSDLVGLFFEAETGERGYVLTGRAEYLEPYGRATSAAVSELARLGLLVADDARQRSFAAAVAQLMETKLGEMRRVVETRERDGRGAALALIDTDEGFHTMGALQEKLSDMQAEEEGLLDARLARQRRYGSLAVVSLVVASVLFGLTAATGLVWGRTAEARRQALAAAAARLRTENDALALRQLNARFQEQFMAILSHDLRGPLSSVTMGVAVLRRSPPSNQPAVLDRMASSAARMGRMIEQLLDLTRTRLGGGIPLAHVPVNMGKLVTDVVDEARTAYPGREVNVETSGPLDGEWDPDRLAQVLSNLVCNALSHGGSEAPVEVRVEGAGAVVGFSVHNTGPAIPEALAGSLFDPFRRGERDNGRSGTAGLGLGLYIAREIVRAHHGTIDFLSNEREGTTFRVELPRRPDVLAVP